jgi:hypothetical protein
VSVIERDRGREMARVAEALLLGGVLGTVLSVLARSRRPRDQR